MEQWINHGIFSAVLVIQYLCGYLCTAFLLRALLYKQPRWAQLWSLRRTDVKLTDKWLGLAGLSRRQASFRERESLLLGCGFRGDAAIYVLSRRLLLILVPLFTVLVWRLWDFADRLGLSPKAVLAAAAAVIFALLYDKPALESYQRFRGQRITREIYIVSNQLLYYAGSSLHIHVKLVRCLPYTTVIRSELQRLLGEWYHDSGGAVRRFKERLGTPEGISFAETIESLRLHEDATYYELLKERIEDYKAKIELSKESRKESASYVLFGLAGIPILYTFQIFIYPWVQEGQKLFQSLNP